MLNIALILQKKIAKVDKIILSTDSNLIRNIGRKKGLNINHLRPKRLSKANTSSYASAIYEVKRYEKNNNKIDAIVYYNLQHLLGQLKLIIN